MAGDDLYAMEWLEFPDPDSKAGELIRVAPGQRVPTGKGGMEADSVAELKRHRSIGTEQQWKKKQSDDDASARRARIRALAEAEGLTIKE
jgi:hypothetical protein